ncbi:sensor histidine kinase [Pseudanabaena yagii]|uniref:histidine kinase n=1 Tax=Pseudanabaena yagii GIHE-NHR1 TaxID=2722753 RepID=A0ABX1LQ72_9CYAN|nr:HAMP domain-containing sensor histidine kinase [Pseudanabaena yagii]NMF58262.1 HAMP domain-containing histidine kinase [Pseudanabaena yagii GIHE-NHR1]
MFQKTRLRLLLAYLGIFASILSIFAIAVRTVFVHTMTNQVVDKLTTLGQTVAASSGFKNGRIQVADNLSVQGLDVRRQSLQWIDIQGNTVYIQGNRTLSLPAAIRESIQIQPSKPALISVNIPIVDTYNRSLVGYLRVSQSLEELNETFRQLDLGLIGGAAISLILVSFGGIFLTRQAMQPIEQSFDRLQQFTADASHELRSPLMAIKASSQVAMRYPEGMRPSDADEFRAIAQSAERMTRLTEDLLMLARMDKKLKVTWENINLTELLQHLVNQLQPQAVAKDLTLIYHPSSSQMIKGNSEQILRLFTNLMENAMHYTPASGQITISVNTSGQWIAVSIKDTGIGIAPEQIEHIFDRFWRADTSRSQWTGGSGLGLAIAQSIAESHCGKISVTSQLAVGSCFKVRLPITKS